MRKSDEREGRGWLVGCLTFDLQPLPQCGST